MKKSLERFYPLFVFLVGVLLYVNTIPNSYNLDDELVTINHRTTSKGFAGIKDIFTTYYYEDDFGYEYGYRPITHLSFAIEHQLFGESSQISHSVNVLLYGLLCLLVFVLIRRLVPIRGPTLALLVALVFAVHPLHTEVVASIKNRDEILSLLFGLLAFLSLIRAVSFDQKWKQFILVLVAVMFFALGLYSKSSIISFWLLLPLAVLLVNRENTLFPAGLFYASSTMIAYFLFSSTVSISEFALIAIQGAACLIVAHFGLEKLWKKIYQSPDQIKVGNQKLNEDKPQKYLMFFGLWIAFILSYFLASYFFSIEVFIVGFGLVFVLSFAFYNVQFNSWTGGIVFLALVVIWLYHNDERFLTLGLLIYLLVFEEKIKSQALIYLVPFLLVSMCLAYVEQSPLVILLFLIVYFSLSYFGVWWLVVLSFLTSVEFTLFGMLIRLVFLLILLPTVLTKYQQNKWVRRIANRTVSLVFAVVFLYLVTDVGEFNNAEITGIEFSEMGEEYQGSEVDRPVLFQENPLVQHWSAEYRIVNAATSLTFYLKKFIYPHPLLFYYGYDQIPLSDLHNTRSYLALGVVLALILAVVMLFFKRKTWWGFALLFVLFSLLPYSNLFVPIAGIVAERLAFTASFGFAFLIGLGLDSALTRKNSRVLALILLIFISVVSSYIVVERNKDWRTKLSLFKNDIPHLSRSAQANALYAGVVMEIANQEQNGLANQNAIATAINHFEKAVELYPKYLNYWFDLGRASFLASDFTKAKEALNQSIQIDSTFTEPYSYLLDIANLEGDYASVVKYSKLKLQTEPENLYVLFDLSTALYMTNQYNEALKINDQIIAIDDGIPEAYFNKAYSYIELGDFTQAKYFLEKGKSIAPNHIEVGNIEASIP